MEVDLEFDKGSMKIYMFLSHEFWYQSCLYQLKNEAKIKKKSASKKRDAILMENIFDETEHHEATTHR